VSPAQIYTNVVGAGITFGRFANVQTEGTIAVQYINSTDGAWYVGAVEPTANGLVLVGYSVDPQYMYSLSWSLISGGIASDRW
jgi:hypothetical protein